MCFPTLMVGARPFHIAGWTGTVPARKIWLRQMRPWYEVKGLQVTMCFWRAEKGEAAHQSLRLLWLFSHIEQRMRLSQQWNLLDLMTFCRPFCMEIW